MGVVETYYPTSTSDLIASLPASMRQWIGSLPYHHRQKKDQPPSAECNRVTRLLEDLHQAKKKNCNSEAVQKLEQQIFDHFFRLMLTRVCVRFHLLVDNKFTEFEDIVNEGAVALKKIIHDTKYRMSINEMQRLINQVLCTHLKKIHACHTNWSVASLSYNGISRTLTLLREALGLSPEENPIGLHHRNEVVATLARLLDSKPELIERRLPHYQFPSQPSTRFREIPKESSPKDEQEDLSTSMLYQELQELLAIRKELEAQALKTDEDTPKSKELKLWISILNFKIDKHHIHNVLGSIHSQTMTNTEIARLEPRDYVPARVESEEVQDAQIKIQALLDLALYQRHISPKYLDILRKHEFEGLTLDQIKDLYGVSKERIRNLLAEAKNKLTRLSKDLYDRDGVPKKIYDENGIPKRINIAELVIEAKKLYDEEEKIKSLFQESLFTYSYPRKFSQKFLASILGFKLNSNSKEIEIYKSQADWDKEGLSLGTRRVIFNDFAQHVMKRTLSWDKKPSFESVIRAVQLRLKEVFVTHSEHP